MRIVVCIITYRRPEGLTRLLRALDGLTFRAEPPDVRCLVVDNDPARTARAVCDEVGPTLRWPLQYGVEPRHGIPFARNKAVAWTRNRSDFIAFVDDDEVPEPRWLDELIRVQRENQADVVTGPVRPHFMGPVPDWIRHGDFYTRPRYPTGTRLDRAFTGNVLFRSAIFHKMDRLFDERLAATGGSDDHFSRRVHRAGYRIVWADDAVAYEWLPPSRVGAPWILQRAFRVGTTSAFTELDLDPHPETVRRLARAGVGRLVKGFALLPVGCLLGKQRLVQYARFICYGSGQLAGLFGVRYHEYHRTHGS